MQVPKYIDVVKHGDSVTVRNNATGCAITYRDGMEVSSEGNVQSLTKNNRAAMATYAALESIAKAA